MFYQNILLLLTLKYTIAKLNKNMRALKLH